MKTTLGKLLAWTGRFHPMLVHLLIGGLAVLLCLEAISEHAPEPVRGWIWVNTGAAAEVPAAEEPEKTEVFAHLVQPILAKHCVACHGPRAASGDLRLDSHAALLAGGIGGPAVVPSDPAKSSLYFRIALPEDDPERMPPEGHPTAPTDDQIALIRWWIVEGAPADALLADLKPDAKVRRLLDALQPQPAPKEPGGPDAEPGSELLTPEQVDPLIADLRERYQGGVRRIAGERAWVDADLSLRGEAIDDAALEAISELGPNLRALYLGGTAVTDEGVRTAVRRMPNLTILHLDRTAVTDAVLEPIADLPRLEVLNLYGTGVTDAGLPALERLASLRSLSLWKTQVTEEGVRRLAQSFEDPERVRQWEREIAELQQKILRHVPSIQFGDPAPE